MNKINFQNIKNFLLRKKKLVILILIVLIGVSFFIFQSKKSDVFNFSKVEYADLIKSVRATGQVISNINLDLSFNKSGIVKSVRVSVGDIVKNGQILANLDQGQALATLTQARGALLGAEAKYKKIVEGASNEDVALAEVILKNAETDLKNTTNNQDTLVANAYQALLNSSLAAFSTSTSETQLAPIISGTYTLAKEGDMRISVSQGGGSYFKVSGIIDYLGSFSTTTAQPIGDSGLYILFPTNFFSQNDWVVSIPNKKATNYLTNYNAYKNALDNRISIVSGAQSLVDQKQAELNLKKATARNVDVDIAQAEVLSAQGSLQSAQSSYEDNIIRAPASGTITKVDIKYGEQGEVNKPLITLEDLNNLYIEALINEANIVYLKTGQNVVINFDAFGSDKKFTGTIAHIDPSANTNDGVVNYKIKVLINEKNDTIRPGMNANIDVLAGESKNVLVIPDIAIKKRDGKSFVSIVVDEKKKKYQKREVQAGFIGDNNLIEIVSGLKQGDWVVLLQD